MQNITAGSPPALGPVRDTAHEGLSRPDSRPMVHPVWVTLDRSQRPRSSSGRSAKRSSRRGTPSILSPSVCPSRTRFRLSVLGSCLSWISICRSDRSPTPWTISGMEACMLLTPGACESWLTRRHDTFERNEGHRLNTSTCSLAHLRVAHGSISAGARASCPCVNGRRAGRVLC